MKSIAGLVTPGLSVADVGTDHAFIPVWLVGAGISPGAIAMDINRGPLERASEHIHQYGLDDQIETRLSDGMKMLHAGEAESVIISGLGGNLMIRILTDGRNVLPGVRELILQPQSEIARVCRFLREAGWRIVDEDMVLEDGKFYRMMKAVLADVPKLSEEMQELADSYGLLLLERHHPVMREYLEFERKVQEEIREKLRMAQRGELEERKRQVEHVLERNRKALQLWNR